MVLENQLGILIGLLLALVLLKFSGFLTKIKKSATLIAAGAMFFIIDLTWNSSALVTKVPANIAAWITFAWELAAFILIVVGAIWSAIELIKQK